MVSPHLLIQPHSKQIKSYLISCVYKYIKGWLHTLHPCNPCLRSVLPKLSMVIIWNFFFFSLSSSFLSSLNFFFSCLSLLSYPSSDGCWKKKQIWKLKLKTKTTFFFSSLFCSDSCPFIYIFPSLFVLNTIFLFSFQCSINLLLFLVIFSSFLLYNFFWRYTYLLSSLICSFPSSLLHKITNTYTTHTYT